MTATFQRHRPDLAALTFGLLFLLAGIGAIAAEADWIEFSGRRAFGGAVLAVGVVGAISALVGALRSRTGRETRPDRSHSSPSSEG